MELQSITEMIIEEARESAELIVKNAEDLAESILEKEKQLGIKEASEKASMLLKKAANDAEAERLRKLTNAKTTANWIILSRKERIIDSVIEAAKEKLRTLTETKKYRFILEKLIVEASIAIGAKESEVLLNEKDSASSMDFGKIAKEIRERTGLETKLTLSAERIEAMGGAVVRKSDGKVVMDNTFEDIINRREKEIRSKISKLLF